MNAALTEVNAVQQLPTNTMAAANPILETQTSSPTAPTTTPEILPGPTAASIEQNVFAQDLLNRNHEILASSSTTGPKDYVYSAYLFRNNRIDPIVDETRTEICRLAIYRLDKGENELLRSFTGPLYAPNSRYTYPVYCEAVNWDALSKEIIGDGEISAETRALLGMNGYWSDINQNGLPEFAVFYQYCIDGCLDYGAVAVHFYEIKNTYQPTDITANLPGVIQPWNIVHKNDPLDIWVYDHTLEYNPLVYIDSSWVYAWNGSQYANITVRYKDEYTTKINEIATTIRNEYGVAMTESRTDLLQILVLSNKADLPQSQTLNTFLDVTDLAHWPGTNPTLTCWLQLARAYAQRDATKGNPFSLPPNLNTIDGPNLDDILEALDPAKYDVSACNNLP